MKFIKKNIERIIDFLKYIWERIICISLLLIFIIIITILFFNNSSILNPENIASQQVLFLGISLENLSIWLTLIALITTALWSMYQYTKNRVAKQQEKASEIAIDFADNIIERMGMISDVLTADSKIKEIINHLNPSKLNQFTFMEILEILDEKYIDDFFEVVESPKTQKEYNKILEERYNKKEREKFDSCFPLLIENTLNKLEAICINISSKAAGSQFIYESLHQMFLDTIEILAIGISVPNKDNINKYYTNIISVYNMWNIQKNNDKKKFNKTIKKVQKLEKKREKEIKKLLTKQTKTV